MRNEIWCVLTTVERSTQATQMAHEAVEAGLAACAQIESPVKSVFKWKGALQETAELRLLFKVSPEKRDTLEKWIKAHHPYEIPEILAWPVKDVDPDYATWVSEA